MPDWRDNLGDLDMVSGTVGRIDMHLLHGTRDIAGLLLRLTHELRDLQKNPDDVEGDFDVRQDQLIDQLQKEGSVPNFETPLYKKDGSIFWASLKARAVRDENNEFNHQGSHFSSKEAGIFIWSLLGD